MMKCNIHCNHLVAIYNTNEHYNPDESETNDVSTSNISAVDGAIGIEIVRNDDGLLESLQCYGISQVYINQYLNEPNFKTKIYKKSY